MNGIEMIHAVRNARVQKSPVELAELMGELLGRPITQGVLIVNFFKAFPHIPLGVLLQAGAWHRVSAGAMTDDEFNLLLELFLNKPG
jgi:hypothetical protein